MRGAKKGKGAGCHGLLDREETEKRSIIDYESVEVSGERRKANGRAPTTGKWADKNQVRTDAAGVAGAHTGR
jgi:hypothetical protein